MSFFNCKTESPPRNSFYSTELELRRYVENSSHPRNSEIIESLFDISEDEDFEEEEITFRDDSMEMKKERNAKSLPFIKTKEKPKNKTKSLYLVEEKVEEALYLEKFKRKPKTRLHSRTLIEKKSLHEVDYSDILKKHKTYTENCFHDSKFLPSSNESPFVNSITKVPTDILIEIFSFLEPEDLGRISSVCKRWNKMTSINSLWIPLSFLYYPQETKKLEEKNKKKKNYKEIFLKVFQVLI
jgi:hypothetical protein